MTTAQVTSMILIVLCSGVMFQTLRLTKLLRDMRPSEFAKIIAPIDQSTAASRAMLDELRLSLAAEAEEQAATLESSMKVRRELDALREELSIIIGVGDSVADRITAAIGAATPTKPAAGVEAGARSAQVDDRDAATPVGAGA